MSRRLSLVSFVTDVVNGTDQASPQSWLLSFLGREIASRGQSNLKRFIRGVAMTTLIFFLSPGLLLASREVPAVGRGALSR